MLSNEEQMLASYFVLLMGRLTGWNYPVGDGGGDPVYLTGEQKTAIATEGIKLLASYLPNAAAEQVTAAIERLPRNGKHINHDEMLMRIGALGGVVPSVGHTPGNPPGCCVWEQGHLVCVN